MISIVNELRTGPVKKLIPVVYIPNFALGGKAIAAGVQNLDRILLLKGFVSILLHIYR